MHLRNITLTCHLQELFFAQNKTTALQAKSLIPTTNGEISDPQARVFVLAVPKQEAIACQRLAYVSYLKRSAFPPMMQQIAYIFSNINSFSNGVMLLSPAVSMAFYRRGLKVSNRLMLSLLPMLPLRLQAKVLGDRQLAAN